MQHCFAACTQAVCVAEDTSVSFYAPKTLRKFRVERLNGARVCGVHIQAVSSSKIVLHIIDAEATWFQFTLEGGIPSLLRTCSIRLPPLSSPEPASESHSSAKSTRQGLASASAIIPVAAAATIQSVDATAESVSSRKASLASSAVVNAQFHSQQGQLYAVLLTKGALYECALNRSGVSGVDTPSTVMLHTFPNSEQQVHLSVGLTTGLIVVAAPLAGEFYFSLFADRAAVHRSHHTPNIPLQARSVNVLIQSLACSPVSSSVAIGGSRGELLIFVEVQGSHCFSDHWHHTPLTALAFAVDGTSVYTGAQESVLLLWDLVSFCHKKVKIHLGTLQTITPFTNAGAQLLLSCGTATLAIVDLHQRRVSASVEGIEWAAEDVCTGLVVEQWGGSPAVILTGMPNVLRVCDPYTQQSIYSLHVSSQMETIPNPPRHGIQFVGMLNESRSLVTYESFSSTALPPLLRFWEYDSRRKQHVETQTVYSPHSSTALALEVDKLGRRVFTLSCEAVKCWTQTAFAAQDTFGIVAGGWHNHSTMQTPSQQVRSMAISTDGSLCFVADDCLYVYSVKNCKPGERWVLLQMLPQYNETHPLKKIVVSPDCRYVVAAGDSQLFFWSLYGVVEEPTVFSMGRTNITALSAFTDSTVVVAFEDTSLVELRYCATSTGSKDARLGEVVRCIPHASHHPLRHIAPLAADGQRIAAVDAVTGFKVLLLPLGATETSSFKWNCTDARDSGAEEDAVHRSSTSHETDAIQRQLNAFFKEMDSTQEKEESQSLELGQRSAMSVDQQTTQSDRWLAEVLGEPSYTVPPMSSILATFLQRQF